MRIGIDARFYGPMGKGLGRYVQKLIKYLEKIDRQNDYFIFLRKENFKDYQPRNPRFKKVLADCKWYSLKEQITIPFKIWQYKIDLMHFPHFNAAVFSPCKFIVTIHDLIITKFPTARATTLGPFLYKIKWIGYGLIIHLAVKRAEKIIAVSNFTKKELINYFKIKPDKIVVTYEAANEESEEKESLANSTAVQFLMPDKPYLLYVGNVYPHKNLENLLKAFKILSKQNDLRLVLVGKEDYFYKRLKVCADELDLGDKIIFTGFVKDEDLKLFYENALIYVFPSFCEGFGLPGLEAMNYELPVAASRNSSLPEIYGAAAIYFNPDDIHDMAEKIGQLIKSKELRENLIKKGLERVKKYSWQKCAEQTLEIYKKYER
ncbi:MAG: Glycosyl transferase, group 1 [Parcubacteria group bacterium Athens1014_10]|nr:MAG: Glycosyl transferase, group 1 [Parcubacteria group bacterium Athens1014_10]TSD04884.1 MAG: Glycosyl transferase, group 1 [Parcubacteria group bacterium Athens0714_12]